MADWKRLAKALILADGYIEEKEAEIIKKGARLSAPLQLTWSCYRENTRACGKCDSCLLRLRAFSEAEMTDPIPYLLDTARSGY